MGTIEEHMPNEDRLRALLVGRKVTSAQIAEESPGHYGAGPTGYLTLSDGTELKVWGNDGGCACNAGCYPLTELNAVDNIITNVEVEENPAGDDDTESYEGYYRIFVFAEDRRFPLASFEGSDGNGYYGTGWWLQVSRA
jgi:hypothetical protein